MSAKTCPLLGLELIKLQESIKDMLNYTAAGDAAVEIIKSMLVGVVANAIIDVLENGTDIYDTVAGKISDLIDSVSPTSWIMYGIGNIAKEINGAAKRERDMLRSVALLINQLNAPFKSKSNKYILISKRARRNMKAAKGHLSLSMASTTAKQMSLHIKNAKMLADATRNILTDRISGARSTLSSTSSLLNAANTAITNGPIKSLSGEVGDSVVRGMSARMRKDIIAVFTPIMRRYVTLCQILYMYSGINYLPQASILNARLRRAISMFNLGELNGHTHIDEELTALSQDMKIASAKMIRDIKGSAGLYNHSMSNKYDVKDTSDRKALSWASSGSEFESYLAASPFSSVPNENLTIFGASTKLATTISLYNTLTSKYAEQYYGGMTSENDISRLSASMDDMKTNKIPKAIQDISDGDDGPYEFDDGLGMSGARADIIYVSLKLAELERHVRGDVQNEMNFEHIKNVAKAIRLYISEPAMGVAIATNIILPYAANPYYNSETSKKALLNNINKRLAYLREVIEHTQPIMSYSNSACESVVSELREYGFSALADAASYGQIVTGAVNVMAGIAGGGGALYDMYMSCVHDSKLSKTNYRAAQDALGKAKKGLEDAINKAVNIALKPIGYNMALIHSMQLRKEKVVSIRQRILELQDAIEEASQRE